jgi:hypothetical protein
MYRDWEKDKRFAKPIIGHPSVDREMAQEEKADPDSFKVEFRSNFAEVIDAFLNPEMVDRIFDPEWNAETIGYKPMPQMGGAAYQIYAGHGDPATVKANFGLCIGHLLELPNENGDTEQHVVFDFIDAFYPDDFDNHTIDWLEIMPAITELINNFRPQEFTFDQYESAQTIQILQDNVRKMNIDTNIYSIFASPKVNDVRAKNFRAAINLGRVHAPHPNTYHTFLSRKGDPKNSIELVRNELKFLTEKNGKVDRQTVGPVQTKDIADCMMTVVNTLIGDSIMNSYGNLWGNNAAW